MSRIEITGSIHEDLHHVDPSTTYTWISAVNLTHYKYAFASSVSVSVWQGETIHVTHDDNTTLHCISGGLVQPSKAQKGNIPWQSLIHHTKAVIETEYRDVTGWSCF
jgi:hypothetical protein